MAKHSKRYRNAAASFEPGKSYTIADAVQIIKSVSSAKFDETIDLSVKLNLKKGQTLRDTMVLPHQTSSDKKILVFARGEKAEEATNAGATFVGDNEYIEKIQGGWLDFDVVISTPDMMKEVGKLGAILGRRGLMPNPKTKTVTTDIAQAITELKKGRIEIRADKNGILHVSVGKSSMQPEQLTENIESILAEVNIKKPNDVKGIFVRSVYVSPTMGPGIGIEALVK